MSEQFEVLVIGGGQAGLAMGYYLTLQRRPFLILDAAPATGHAWRTRYDSLKLFTPAQFNSLPGLPFPGPAGAYPTKDDVADYLAAYARHFNLPIHPNAEVQLLRQEGTGYRAVTADATYYARQVVIATGPFQRPFTPALSAQLAPEVYQIHSSAYRNPAQLPEGPAVVVGAGNSGAQIAAELAERRPVFLSAGHRPPYLPQRFLGQDLFWWLHKLGLMNVTGDSRLGRAMRKNDPLIGTDLSRVARRTGLQLVGRVERAEGSQLFFSGGRTAAPASVIWATGFRLDYSWVDVPVLDKQGAPVHRRGVTDAPGLYFLGQTWQYRRGSALLGGVGRDAEFLSAVMAGY